MLKTSAALAPLPQPGNSRGYLASSRLPNRSYRTSLYGLCRGVGRGLAVGVARGVGEATGVAVAVAVAVGVALPTGVDVEVDVAVGVALGAVAVAVAVGVGDAPPQGLTGQWKISNEFRGVIPSLA